MEQTAHNGEPGAEVVPFPGAHTAESPAPAVAVAVTKDAETGETEVIEGELVESGAPVPVDDPTVPPPGGWLAERRAYLDAAPPVIPSYLRNRGEFAENVMLAARYYTHKTTFHLLRVPLYTGRLWLRAPAGAGRMVGAWYRWVTDAEAKPVLAKAAGTGDVQAWTKLTTLQTQRTNFRRKASLVVMVPVALLVTLAAVFLPDWALGLAAAGVASLLGLAGRDADKPIVSRYVAVHVQRRLDSGEIVAALEAIKVKGEVRFVAPIAVDGPGWRAELDLPGGYLADEVLEKRAALAAAMRRPLGTVWPETDPDAHPGRLVLWVAKVDPAKTKRRLWPLMKDGQANLFEAIPFGFDPRGRLVELDLMYANVLIGGVMGSGKTSAVLVIALAGALDPTCEMWIYEMKGSGDLDAVRPVCHRYVSGDDDEDCKAALDGLKALEREMKRRKRIIKELPLEDVPNGRKVYPHLAARKNLRLHPILAIFDEAHTLFEHPKYGKEAAEVAGRLIRKARAYGIILVFTTQRPDANSIPRSVSDNAIVRFCLAVTGHLPNDLILGTGAWQRGVRGTMFDPAKDAGTGWLARSALNYQIARAAFIKQDEAAEIGRRALALRTAAGTLSGQAAGEAITPEDDTDLLDDLRAVWPAGETAMHSHRLVEALAAYRPDRYGAWIATDKPADQMTDDELREARAARSTLLAQALKPYGVQTRQINKRGDGGSAKGVRWDDLPDPRDGTRDDAEDDSDDD
ncbi:FtsK/SpoIIIE domain-containing protein [Thermomonospora cellulosilytica]|uniref:S-DNA-T family DNA segregation ATPase FtsK/SpoIIIE n=1 Tax=Thermomonospora cellulosilytica TaxID=1411118 RepID=A0A7W3R732_9ACTN|nr:FtsK/SpoIIIE domain-containing protein [Thermomonospora cellulosilytica]MBA9002054.1 S-DNA-T family DNA segregation ATPase FtsK/SpoIIIE [Thermomonospora cellulosilytica]